MLTRRRFWGLGVFATVGGTTSVVAAKAAGRNPNVVYHLADLDKASSVLGNIRNHFAGVGEEPVEIVLIVHGGALRAFHGSSAALDITEALQELVENHQLRLLACSNTMRAMGTTVIDLLPGFRAVESGVVAIAQLQTQGYVYIRP
jgi:intracellular sulfur oxidation DsrE/DsrF family protein